MDQITDLLKGKRTFIVAGLLILGALGRFISAGDYTAGSVLNFLQSNQVDLALLATTLRLALLKK